MAEKCSVPLKTFKSKAMNDEKFADAFRWSTNDISNFASIWFKFWAIQSWFRIGSYFRFCYKACTVAWTLAIRMDFPFAKKLFK